MASNSWKPPKYNDNPFSDPNQPIATTPPWLVETSTNTPGGYKQVSLDDNEMDATVQINFHSRPATNAPPPPPPITSYNNSSNSNAMNTSFSSGYPGISSANNNHPNPSSLQSSTEIDPAIPRMITYTRVINLALSIGMILISLLAILTTQSATTGVLACYVVVFACLLCCFETHLKQVSKIIALNFGFMYSAKSRAVFMIFIGTIMFSFSLFGKILALCMIGNALFNIFILFKYPQFDDIQRDNATSEIREFLQSNPAFTQTVVQGSTNYLASNPDFARQGFQAMFSSMFSGGGGGGGSSGGVPSGGINSNHGSINNGDLNKANYVSV